MVDGNAGGLQRELCAKNADLQKGKEELKERTEQLDSVVNELVHVKLKLGTSESKIGDLNAKIASLERETTLLKERNGDLQISAKKAGRLELQWRMHQKKIKALQNHVTRLKLKLENNEMETEPKVRYLQVRSDPCNKD